MSGNLWAWTEGAEPTGAGGRGNVPSGGPPQASAWGLVEEDEDEEEESEEPDEEEEYDEVDMPDEVPITAMPPHPPFSLRSRDVRLGTVSEKESEEEEELAPSEFNTLNYGNFLKVSTDKRSILYTGEGQHGNDVGAIQANRAVPSKRLIYYYEVRVQDGGQRQCIAVGFSDQNFKLSRQPGWEHNSFGYHGDDGKKYHASGRGEAFAASFTTGDVVGAGVHLGKRQIFFTRNGKMLGAAFSDVKLPLYPTVGLHSKNERVTVNFGDQPFAFDLETMIAEERQQMQEEIARSSLSANLSHDIVRQFLEHYGCHGTLTALDASCGIREVDEGMADNDGGKGGLELRAEVRQLILSGDVDGAMRSLQAHFPSVPTADPSVPFNLHCQQFLELVRTGDTAAAVLYARKFLAPYRGSSPYFDHAIQEVTATLAYSKPSGTAVEHLMAPAHREIVADVVNAAILHQQQVDQGLRPKGPIQSSLERLLRQVAVCQQELREANGGGLGEIFQLQFQLQQSANAGSGEVC